MVDKGGGLGWVGRRGRCAGCHSSTSLHSHQLEVVGEAGGGWLAVDEANAQACGARWRPERRITVWVRTRVARSRDGAQRCRAAGHVGECIGGCKGDGATGVRGVSRKCICCQSTHNKCYVVRTLIAGKRPISPI